MCRKLLPILLRVSEMKQTFFPVSEYDGDIKEIVGSFVRFEGPTGILVKIHILWMLNCVGCKQLTVC